MGLDSFAIESTCSSVHQICQCMGNHMFVWFTVAALNGNCTLICSKMLSFILKREKIIRSQHNILEKHNNGMSQMKLYMK